MSNTIRQSNIFGDYNWRIAYESFLEADYASYDYDSIYQSMVSYIQRHYSEQFNDYIRHSELLAHVNMLAYLGQNITFRNDVNTIENFMDDAKRRESVIKIASSMTYRAKRNLAASGLLKITGISSTDSISDSNGNTLENIKITWGQQGNPIWYDSFIKIIESAMNPEYKFGKPFQKASTTNPLEVYELRQSTSSQYVIPFTTPINGRMMDFEAVPVKLVNDVLQERPPSSDDPFSIIYKNERNGSNSPDTGFFVYIKQGNLQYRDFHYDIPKVDRREIIDVNNINNSDVWVSEVDENGMLNEYWHDIPSQIGQNIIYNEIDLNERNIFFSKTLKNDMVEILYGDGNFSLAPTNNMRVHFRQSANETFKIRPYDISDYAINIPYVNERGIHHTLTLFVTNMVTIDNSEVSETLNDIKQGIIDSHYTQERMVTIEDYNIFPLERNPLRKLLTKNRDNNSKTRYPFLDTTDPTGLHSNINVTANDGYIFDEYYEHEMTFTAENSRVDVNTIPSKYIEPYLSSEYFKSFYTNVVFLYNLMESPLDYYTSDIFPKWVWENQFIDSHCQSGMFVQTLQQGTFNTVNIGEKVRKNYKLLFTNKGKKYWSTVISVENDVVRLTDHIPTNSTLELIIPSTTTFLSDDIKEDILARFNKRESFGLRYDDKNYRWILINQDNIINTDDTYNGNSPLSTTSPDDRWLIRFIFTRDIDESRYNVTIRGLRIVFGSEKQVRFFFKNTDVVDDIKTGIPSIDNISVMRDAVNFGLDIINPKNDVYRSKSKKNLTYLDDMDT